MELKHKGWREEGKYLVKTFAFDDFKEAIAFVNIIASLAEDENHHPDLEVFDFKNVKIKLTSHNKGGVSEKDIEMAERIDYEMT